MFYPMKKDGMFPIQMINGIVRNCIFSVIHFIHDLDLLYLQPNRSSLTKENADYPEKHLKIKVSEITILLPLQIMFYG